MEGTNGNAMCYSVWNVIVLYQYRYSFEFGKLEHCYRVFGKLEQVIVLKTALGLPKALKLHYLHLSTRGQNPLLHDPTPLYIYIYDL